MFPKILILLLAAISVLAEEECFDYFTVGLMYRELGCKPVFQQGSKCPSHFDCSNYNAKSKTCNYKGNTYDIGFELPAENTSPCVANCKCVKDKASGLGRFSCAAVECFDWHLENETCTRLYSEDSCCSINTHCKGDPPLPTCLVDGNVYVEGQKFYPSQEPCKECLCKAGFDGKFVEPFCRDVQCDIELHYATKIQENCVPVYYGSKGCCPIDWICPSSTKGKVTPIDRKLQRNTDAVCKYGYLEFKQFEGLETKDPTLQCSCLVPPSLTCIRIPA